MVEEALGQFDRRLMRFVSEAVIVGQRLHLPSRRFDQPLLAEAERGAPEARHPLDIFLALVVIDVHPVAVGDDQRPFRLMRLKIRVGMQQGCDVAARRRITVDSQLRLQSSGAASGRRPPHCSTARPRPKSRTSDTICHWQRARVVRRVGRVIPAEVDNGPGMAQRERTATACELTQIARCASGKVRPRQFGRVKELRLS